jgi:hypothetical protein
MRLSADAAIQATRATLRKEKQSAMEMPQVRPGAVTSPESKRRVVAFFHNAAEGNLAIQILTSLGTPNDRLGVTPPDQIEGGQGMILSIGCQDERTLAKAEDVCRKLGGRVHRQRV